MLSRGLIRPFLLACLLIAALALAFACDDDEEEAPPGSPTAPAGAIDISDVPELADGELLFGSDIAYAPMEFFRTGTETPDGFDIDLAKAIGEKLGVQVEFVNSGFDGLIPALTTRDFDAIMSSMTITDEREEQIDFAAYLNVGTGILVETGNPNNIQELEDLCGLTVAVQLGTIQEQMANEIDCSGGKSVNVVTFDTNPSAVEDLRTGGADANLADFPVASLDAEESDGDLEVLEANVDPAPYGIGIRKESTQLKDVLEQALDALKEDGTYDDLLAKWKLESLALD